MTLNFPMVLIFVVVTDSRKLKSEFMNKRWAQMKPYYLLGHGHRGGVCIPVIVRDWFRLLRVSQERRLVEHTKLILRLFNFGLELPRRCLAETESF